MGADVWDSVVEALQLQMAQATFDQLLRGSQLLRIEDDGTWLIGVTGEYAVGHLTNRLRAVVERQLARSLGVAGITVRFEARPMEIGAMESAQAGVEQVEAESLSVFELPEYDVLGAGFFQMASYESLFWAPFLGRIPWRVVEIVRETDKRGKRRTTWTPARRWTAPSLAELVPCGRQAIVGVNRACAADHLDAFEIAPGVWQRHSDGAFDRLRVANVATVERRGDPPRVTYWVSVRNQLGLLRPEQVIVLAPRLQEKHDRWLADHGFDPRCWDFSS